MSLTRCPTSESQGPYVGKLKAQSSSIQLIGRAAVEAKPAGWMAEARARAGASILQVILRGADPERLAALNERREAQRLQQSRAPAPATMNRPAPAQGFEYPPAVRGLGVLHCIVGFVEFVVMIIAYSSLACWPGRTESCAAAIHQSWSFIFFYIIP